MSGLFRPLAAVPVLCFHAFTADTLQYARSDHFANSKWHLNSSLSVCPLRSAPKPADILTSLAELIDKCVGSKIWVVMKGDKGTLKHSLWLST